MAEARVIRMDVRCVKTHCLLSLQGGYDHRGVNVRGLIDDCVRFIFLEFHQKVLILRHTL